VIRSAVRTARTGTITRRSTPSVAHSPRYGSWAPFRPRERCRLGVLAVISRQALALKRESVVIFRAHESVPQLMICRSARIDRSLGRPVEEFAVRLRIVLLFLVHSCRRATWIESTMAHVLSFDEMLLRLSPVAARRLYPAESIPGRWVAATAELFACLFPRVWRRRCLFRSLLILDWAHRSGVHPTLNVGMHLESGRESGHCWLTVGNRPFCEPGDWSGRYGVLFYRRGDLQHWASTIPGTQSAKTPGARHRGAEGT
jgi:hypothetical protein